MAFIPYSRQSISQEDIDAVTAILRADFLTQGPAIGVFEQAFALRHGVAHAVAVANATAGLHIACLALGVGPGSRVWTSPNSFVASANCALYCGAEVDFVDIDERTRNMSADALEAKLERAAKVGQLPNVVIPVDFAGLPCELRRTRELGDRYGFKILEDASHATGASYLGKPIGSEFAHLSVFSFHAVKIITTAEGGIVTTQDDQVAARLRLLRSHGTTRDARQMERKPEGDWYYEQQLLGFNYRMTDLQAALGVSQLKRLDEWQGRRAELAGRYDTLLSECPVLLPARISDRQSAWHLYVIEIDESSTTATRARVFQRLRHAGIGVNVHYIPIHTQPFYARLGFREGDFPVCERYYGRALSIPLYPALSEDDQVFVVRALSEALG